MKKLTTLVLLAFSFSLLSQRAIVTFTDGAALKFLPISVSGLPDCNYKNSGLVLSFSDEFNDTILDQSKWNTSLPWGQTINGIDAWCDSNEIHLTGTTIKLGANKKYNPNVYIDGRIESRDYSIGVVSTKQTFGYGYYQLRCKIPRIAQHWPSFWLFGDCAQEIDIFEFSGAYYKPSKKKLFHDRLSYCTPHREKWYTPQICATAEPFMSIHTPKNTIAPCQSSLCEWRTTIRNLQYHTWNVKHTPLKFDRGCEYGNIKVDVDFHADWHTFGLAYTPEYVTFLIDSVPVITEYRYFKKQKLSLNSIEEYIPTCLGGYCFSNDTNLFEQVNFPQGNIDMRVIFGNGHSKCEDYNLIKWIDDYWDWPEGFLEVDYFRYYKYTSCDQTKFACIDKNQHLNFNYTIYPNPSRGRITVSTNNALVIKEVRIFDLSGREVFSSNFQEPESGLDLNTAAGIYILELSVNGQRKYSKIVIE
jgi:hypothetical protein